MNKYKIVELSKSLGKWAAGLIGTVIITAFLKGDELKGLTTLAKAKYLFHLSMPSWLGLVIGSLGLWAVLSLVPLRRAKNDLAASKSQTEIVRSLNASLEKEKAHLEGRLKEFTSKEPRLHAVWNTAQAIWSLGRKGAEPMMQIGGWIDITLSNTPDPIILLAAYIGDQRADIFMDVRLEPGRVNRVMVMLYMVPPLSTQNSKPYTATIVVEDQFNRRYELPTQEFRATPGRTKETERILQPEPMNSALGATSDAELSFDTLDYVGLRIERYEHQDIKGLALRADNNRRDPIQQIRVIIADAQSYDAGHADYRKGSNFTSAVMTDPNLIQPSCSSRSMVIVHKRADNLNLLAGNDTGHPMLWPENDKSDSEQWRFVLRFLAMKSPTSASEKPIPLRELSVSLVLVWNRASNVFAIRQETEKREPRA